MQNNYSNKRIPKCTHCGYVGEWDVEPLFRPMDWVIGILLICLFGTGLVYLGVVALIRSNPDNRAKICRQCKARNLFTFVDENGDPIKPI